MAKLFIAGNTNQYTFGNAALAAHLVDRQRGGEGLNSVFVLHSPESELRLTVDQGWRSYIRDNGLDPEVFVHFMVDLTLGEKSFARATRHIETCLAGLDHREEIYIDLTNGPSIYKAFLTSVGYILGVRRQFLLDSSINRLNSGIDGAFLRPKITSEFWPSSLLIEAYLELPDPSLLDSIALTWHTDVRRFRLKAEEMAESLLEISQSFVPQKDGFIGDVSQAVNSWLKGEQKSDGALLGGAVRYVGRAFEELVKTIYKEISPRSGPAPSLNDMVRDILARLNPAAGDFEPDLIHDMAHLLRRLRNASTHEQTASDFGQIRARLSIELLMACSRYFSVLHSRSLLDNVNLDSRQVVQKVTMTGTPGATYYFGLDGDDTGRQLEQLFQRPTSDSEFSKYSRMVELALSGISKRVKEAPLRGEVLFCSGDDILFRASYVPEVIDELRSSYFDRTAGLTCSVGFGRTPREAYVALKIAKASPGKNCVVGVELVNEQNSTTKAPNLGLATDA